MQEKDSGAKKTFWQLIKFGIIGVMNTVVDFVVYTALVLIFSIADDKFLPLAIVQVVSYSCGILNSYLFNTRWTFKQEHKKSKKEFILFIGVNIVSLLVSLGMLYICRTYVFSGSSLALSISNGALFGLKPALDKTVDILSKLIATPVALIVNFIGNKLFVFKTKTEA